MAKIVIAPYGSLGDLHPLLALALELRERGHELSLCTLEAYREKIEMLGIEFCPMRPDVNEEDRDLAREIMDPKTGSEKIIREIMLPALQETYEDLMDATEGADLLINGRSFFRLIPSSRNGG